jgi:hypothetical protein
MCGKKGRILHGASVSKPSDTAHDGISYWTDEEIQSCNVIYISQWLKLGRGELLSQSGM